MTREQAHEVFDLISKCRATTRKWMISGKPADAKIDDDALLEVWNKLLEIACRDECGAT